MKKQLLLMATSMLLLTACSSTSTSTENSTTKSTSTTTSTSTSSQDTAQSSKAVKIGIIQYAQEPNMNVARQGFLNALKDAGFVNGQNLDLDVQNADGDKTKNDAIPQKFVDEKDQLVLAISTPSAQAAVQKIMGIPILFTAVEDPVDAKIVDSLSPKGNVTGSTSTHPEMTRETMSKLHDFFPKASKVGVLYNPDEHDAKAKITDIEYSMKEFNLSPVEVAVKNTSDVKQAAESLAGKVDAFYIPVDSTVDAGLDAIINVADNKKIPLFVGNADMVKQGAFAGYDINYYTLGYKTGQMAVDILKNGKKPSDFQVKIPDTLNFTMNAKAAAAEGIKLTDEMKVNADVIQ